MSNPLSTELPDRFVQIADDEEAKRFIFALGIWDDLAKDVTFEHSDGRLDHDETAVVAFFDHPTHWILAGRVHNSPTERGFIVLGWPRNKWPRTVVSDFLSKIPLGDSPSFRISKFGDQETPQS